MGIPPFFKQGLIPPASDVTISTSSTPFTLPDNLYYSDGSIGQLKIPSIGVNVKVYEAESLESLAKGAGHFKSTSCWDGNVGIAGHNRGVTNHFGKIHTLKAGDQITYTTQLVSCSGCGRRVWRSDHGPGRQHDLYLELHSLHRPDP
ncbi:sortase [Oscillospiraceae bacterium 50-60]